MVGSKSMRCEAQIARFWLLQLRVSQSLRAHFQTRKHWGREWWLSAENSTEILKRNGRKNKAVLVAAIQKGCIIFKSDSDAPYTERQYAKFGKTKDLNKWFISTWEYCSLLRDLKTCKNLFALTNFSLSCSLNLQLLWTVTPRNADYYTVEYCKFAHNACYCFSS